MSINTLTNNMVEVPRFLITKRKFAASTTYLRNVKWWGLQDERLRKGYLIDSLDEECVKKLLELEENLTLRQIIGRLKLRFEKEILEEDGIEKGKMEEAKKIFMWLQNDILSQRKDQTLEELWTELIDTIENISFKGKLAILAGLCAKSLKKYISWDYIDSKERLLIELRKVDTRHRREEEKGKARKEIAIKENIQKQETLKSNQEHLDKVCIRKKSDNIHRSQSSNMD